MTDDTNPIDSTTPEGIIQITAYAMTSACLYLAWQRYIRPRAELTEVMRTIWKDMSIFSPAEIIAAINAQVAGETHEPTEEGADGLDL
jgi:hypothetical protein